MPESGLTTRQKTWLVTVLVATAVPVFLIPGGGPHFDSGTHIVGDESAPGSSAWNWLWAIYVVATAVVWVTTCWWVRGIDHPEVDRFRWVRDRW